MKNAIPGIPPIGDEHACDYLARVIALHGLGTIGGEDRMEPPNEGWTRADWQRRILGCVPSAVEEQCRDLALKLYKAAGGTDR